MLENLPSDPDDAHNALMEKINEHTEKINCLENKLNDVYETNVSQNTKLEKICTDISGLIEIFKAGSGALKTLKWLGIAVGWLGGLATAVYAIWYAIIHWPHRGG